MSKDRIKAASSIAGIVALTSTVIALAIVEISLWLLQHHLDALIGSGLIITSPAYSGPLAIGLIVNVVIAASLILPILIMTVLKMTRFRQYGAASVFMMILIILFIMPFLSFYLLGPIFESVLILAGADQIVYHSPGSSVIFNPILFGVIAGCAYGVLLWQYPAKVKRSVSGQKARNGVK